MPTWIDMVLGTRGTEVAEPAAQLTAEEVFRELGFLLPSGHVELLQRSNGLRLYDGYFQLFAVGSPLKSWNDLETWKFAWPVGLDEFLCFGETVWGDQYAYRLGELRKLEYAPVYFLDALRMGSRQLASGFTEFGEKYLTRNSTRPFDSVLREAHQALGPMPPSTHLVFSPPLLLNGDENPQNLVKMPARQAMILNGDLWSQLSNPPADVAVAGLDVVMDDRGRDRVRVRWTPTSPSK